MHISQQLSCKSEQAIEQSVELLVIWGTITFLWHHCYAIWNFQSAEQTKTWGMWHSVMEGNMVPCPQGLSSHQLSKYMESSHITRGNIINGCRPCVIHKRIGEKWHPCRQILFREYLAHLKLLTSLTHWPLWYLSKIFLSIIFILIFYIDGWCVSCEIALTWISLDLTDEKSTLVQVMAWCREAASHYLNQCWPRSLSLYGVTRPQWAKCLV